MSNKAATRPGEWKVLDRRRVHDDRWIRLRSDRVELPDGTVLDPFYTLEYPDSVNVIALTHDDQVVLVEQWRHAVGKLTVEFPAGASDAGEEPLAAIRRELLEETGYASNRWLLLGSADANPSRQNNRIFSYLAVDARKVADQKLDPGELVRVCLQPWAALRRNLGTGAHSMGAMHLAAVAWLDWLASTSDDSRLNRLTAR